MARKKQPSIAEMQNRMQELAAEITKEKERMAGDMAKAFLTDEIAAKLGDRSDAELKRIMSMLTVHVDECVAALDAEKQARAAKSEEKPQDAAVYQAAGV